MDKHDNQHENKETNTTNRPSPSDFDIYLPWACNQLQVEVSVVILRVLQRKCTLQSGNTAVVSNLTFQSVFANEKHCLLSHDMNVPYDLHPSTRGIQIYACNFTGNQTTKNSNRNTATLLGDDEYVSMALTDRSKTRAKTKYKLNPSRTEVGSNDKDDKSASGRLQNFAVNENIVRIYTIYDNFDNLVHIKFDKNRNIPRTVLKIFGLIVKFHMYLTFITINKGLDRYSIHELCKILPKSHITDVCLDGTFLEEPNYYLLLENENNLRQISLARCKLDDDAIKKIADNLVYPRVSSKTLSVLNVSSNRITDEGVKYLSEALKSNRRLVYLNLADNMITDDGASVLLDVLFEFPMSSKELIESRQRFMQYLNEKKELISRMVAELRCGDDRKSIKKKNARPSGYPAKKVAKGLEKDQSLKSFADKSITNLDAVLYEKAENLAVNAMGPFTDPYSNINTTSKDGIMYCYGNNSIAYLNLSHNNISFFSVKKLMNVLMYQKLLDRTPRGLINLCIEGNCIPTTCKELAQIDDILDTGLMSQNRSYSGVKKRPLSRGK